MFELSGAAIISSQRHLEACAGNRCICKPSPTSERVFYGVSVHQKSMQFPRGELTVLVRLRIYGASFNALWCFCELEHSNFVGC